MRTARLPTVRVSAAATNCGQNHRHMSKHNLAPTSLRAVINENNLTILPLPRPILMLPTCVSQKAQTTVGSDTLYTLGIILTRIGITLQDLCTTVRSFPSSFASTTVTIDLKCGVEQF